jgi:hypothetical protein
MASVSAGSMACATSRDRPAGETPRWGRDASLRCVVSAAGRAILRQGSGNLNGCSRVGDHACTQWVQVKEEVPGTI